MKQISGKRSRGVLTLVLLISLCLHALVLFLFGTFKLVEHIVRDEKTFVSVVPEELDVPEVTMERPNIEQRNQQSTPPRPNPITVDATVDVDLPALDIDLNVANVSAYGRGSGFGIGTGTGNGNMREMAVKIKATDFGYTGFVEGTLEGTLYDLKRDNRGKDIKFSVETTKSIVRDFTKGTWRRRDLDKNYYSSEKKLYADSFIFKMDKAEKAPEAFDAADEIAPKSILAYYEGTFVPWETGEYRFLGRMDDVLIVNFGGKMVLDGSYHNDYSSFDQTKLGSIPGLKAMRVRDGYVVGKWVKFTAGQPVEMKVLLGETPGGFFGGGLFYQKKGDADDEYRVFFTKKPTSKDKRAIRKRIPELEDYM